MRKISKNRLSKYFISSYRRRSGISTDCSVCSVSCGWTINSGFLYAEVGSHTEIELVIRKTEVDLQKKVVVKVKDRSYENLSILYVTYSVDTAVVHLVSQDYFLKTIKGYEVFTKKSIVEALKLTVEKASLKASTGTSPVLDLLIRYDESLLNFLHRNCFILGVGWKLLNGDTIKIGTIEELTTKVKIEDSEFKILHETCGYKKNSSSRSYSSKNPDLKLESKEKESLFFQDHWTYWSSTPSLISKFNKEQSNLSFDKIFISSSQMFSLFDKVSLDGKDFFVCRIEQEFLSNTCIAELVQSVSFDFEKPKPGLQKATVVSKNQCELIDGNILVKFGFSDLEVPAQLSQNLASKTGFFWVPRRGEEVLINFLDEDPSFPIVIGSAYNEKNKQTLLKQHFGFELCSYDGEKIIDERKTSVLFSFENKKESIEIRAQKDMHILFPDKEEESKYETKIENGNGSLTISKGNYEIKINDGYINIEAKKKCSIKSENANIEIKEKLFLKAQDFEIQCENLNVEATDIKINAKNNISFSSTKMEQEIKTTFKLSAAMIDVQSKATLVLKALQISIESSVGLMLKSIIFMLDSTVTTIKSQVSTVLGGPMILSNPIVAVAFNALGKLIGKFVPGPT